MNDNLQWRPTSIYGAPKRTGWYAVTIKDAAWIDENGNRIEAKIHTGCAYLEVTGDDYIWRHVQEMRCEEYVGEFRNTCVISRRGVDESEIDTDITAWYPLPVKAYGAD